MAVRISSQERTDSQARALTCSREPKSGLQRSGTRVLAENRNRVVNARSVPLPCAAQPQMAPKVAGREVTHHWPTA